MSIATHTMTWPQASALAYKIECQLRPGCERIQVAGSTRRRSPSIGDLEFVIIPRREAGLFGSAQPGESILDVELRRLVDAGRLRPGRCNGERAKHYLIGGADIGVDLYLVTPATWGVQLALRTGPRQYSRSIVTQREFGGRLTDDRVVHDGRVWRRVDVQLGLPALGVDGKRPPGRICIPDPGASPLDTPEEADFLTMAGGWLDPQVRP